MLALVLVSCVRSAHGHDHHEDHGHRHVHGASCGHSYHAEHFDKPLSVPQSYEGESTHEESAERRRLANYKNQNYDGETSVNDFLPLQATAAVPDSAEKRGLLRGIRVKINFEMIEGNTAPNVGDERACYAGDAAANKVINVNK